MLTYVIEQSLQLLKRLAMIRDNGALFWAWLTGPFWGLPVTCGGQIDAQRVVSTKKETRCPMNERLSIIDMFP